jgi:hypothetical protein
MKNIKFFLALIASLILLAFPVWALEETSPEDLPSDADETTVTAEAEPNLPEIKAAQPEYFGLVDIRGNFTTVNMSGVNSALAELISVHPAWTSPSVNKVDIGYMISMDLGFKFFKGVGLTLGPRFDIIGCNTGSFSANDGSGNSLVYDLDTTAIPFMLGGTYTLDISGLPLEASLGVYAGATYVRASVNWLQTTTLPSNYDLTAIYGGFGFAGEISCALKYQFSDTVAGGLNLGYRIASAQSVVAQANVNADSPIAVKGSALQGYSDGKNVAFDLSGFLVGADISMKY